MEARRIQALVRVWRQLNIATGIQSRAHRVRLMVEVVSKEDFPETATVYGLCSTRDDRVRYVGETIGLPNTRFYRHVSQARKGAKGAVNEWIRGELAAGFALKVMVLVEAGTLKQTEKEVIATLRASGHDLLNKTAPKRRGSSHYRRK